jgi:cysteinyl-tRNA synthetase
MKIHNTLTRREEEFKPIAPPEVGMYVCGITAYDSCHIGHARAAVAFDVVVRHLRYKGFKVKFVRNYTDLDDKIINRAGKEKRDWKELAEFYIKEYAEDMAELKNLKPDIEPRATDHIKEMIETIQKLFDNGIAYQTKSGVYFSVRKFNGYGKLSGKNIEDLESGARIAVDEDKNDPLDFALWKASKPDEPKWPSPWGEGRPGWHIECSAMSSKYLGQPFDIHGGGQDLIFPHHENEIAQAEGACGCQFVKYWLHNGFINIDAEKMSKSLGNIKTIRETLKQYDFETLRYFLISSHYRSPLDYTSQALADAAAAVDRFYEMTARLRSCCHPFTKKLRRTEPEKELAKALESAEQKIAALMDDDFNTAGAMGVIFDAVRQINKYLDSACHSERSEESPSFTSYLSSKWSELQITLGNIFGMFNSVPAEYQTRRKKIATSTKGVDTALVEKLIADRASARKSKDFAKADAVKKQLADLGVELKDKPNGITEWKIK